MLFLKKHSWYITITITVLILILGINLAIKNSNPPDEQVYFNQIKTNFIHEINKEPSKINTQYQGYNFNFSKKEKLYDKTTNSFKYYNDNTNIEIIFLEPTNSYYEFQNEYLSTVKVEGELVINEQYINNNEASFLQVYKVNHNEYLVILGEDNAISRFTTNYENLQKNINEATQLVNSVR